MRKQGKIIRNLWRVILLRIRPTIYAKAPFPRNWSTRVDMINPLSLQANPKIDSNLEIYFLKTTVSYGIKRKTELPLKEPLKTKTGIIDLKERTSYSVPFISSTNPTERVYTQREIFEDIISSGISAGLEIPDAVIKERCSVVKIPKQLEDISCFAGWDKILLHELSCSHYARLTYGRYNIRLKSPAKMVRDDLVKHYDFKYRDIPIKRMRSVLQLRSVVGLSSNKVVGWGSLYDAETRTNVSDKMSDALCEGKIFRDTAEPRHLGGSHVDGLYIEPRIFLLRRHQRLISLKLGPEWSIQNG